MQTLFMVTSFAMWQFDEQLGRFAKFSCMDASLTLITNLFVYLLMFPGVVFDHLAL